MTWPNSSMAYFKYISKSMTTTLACSVKQSCTTKSGCWKPSERWHVRLYTKEHNKLWNHHMTCNDFMAHIYSPIQKDDTTVCINTKVSLICILSGLQSINHNAVVPIIDISCWDTHHYSVNSMILWYRFPVILKQQKITICENPTVLIIEITVFHGTKTRTVGPWLTNSIRSRGLVVSQDYFSHKK